eukprot:5396668-Pleurochrysis_carterae.AAC.1
MWHADHDDCGGASDGAFSGNGLVVQGRNVVAYGLKVEHMMRNLVREATRDGSRSVEMARGWARWREVERDGAG